GPSALVRERLWEVPVEEVRERPDARVQQCVDEPVVEVEPRLVDAAAAVGEDTRPSDREAEGVDPQLSHQPHVLGEAVVEVARDRPRVAAADGARNGAEAVPDALAPSGFGDGPLDLVGRRRGSEDETRREGCL